MCKGVTSFSSQLVIGQWFPIHKMFADTNVTGILQLLQVCAEVSIGSFDLVTQESEFNTLNT